MYFNKNLKLVESEPKNWTSGPLFRGVPNKRAGWIFYIFYVHTKSIGGWNFFQKLINGDLPYIRHLREGNGHKTLRSQIEGYTCLLIIRKFSILPAVIWAYPFINFQENFQPPCFFNYTNELFSTLPAVIRAYPLTLCKSPEI